MMHTGSVFYSSVPRSSSSSSDADFLGGDFDARLRKSVFALLSKFMLQFFHPLRCMLQGKRILI